MSTLSAFAEPFQPRDNIALLQKLTENVSYASDAPPKPTSASLRRQQRYRRAIKGSVCYPQDHPVETGRNAAPQQDSLSSGLLSLADDLKNPSVTERPSELPVSINPGMQKRPIIDNEEQALLNRSGFSSREPFSVGYEREQKRSHGSVRLDRSLEQSWSSANHTEREYDMFGGLSFWNRLRSSLSDTNYLKKITAEETDVFANRSFVGVPVANHAESKRLIPSQSTHRERTEYNSVDNLQNSRADLANNNGSPDSPECFSARNIPQLWKTVGSDVKLAKQVHTDSASSAILTNNNDDWQRELEHTQFENGNISDGETTLLADCLLEDNSNELDNVFQSPELDNCDGSDRRELAVDANGNIVDQVNHRTWKGTLLKTSTQTSTGRIALDSVDSGIESLSEYPISFSLPESKPCPDIIPENLSLRRLCPRHKGRPLTLYCMDCCQTICKLCWASDHMDCVRVLTTNMACRALRWQLLRMQSRVGAHIHGLHNKVHELKPQVDGVTKSLEKAKEQLNLKMDQIVEEIQARHAQVLDEIAEEFQEMENQTSAWLQGAEKSLLLLSCVSKFLEVLRQRDSGWELLSTYDHRLGHLLQYVVQSAATNLESIQSHQGLEQLPILTEAQNTALSVVFQVLNTDINVQPTQANNVLDDAFTFSSNLIVNKVSVISDLYNSENLGFLRSKSSGATSRNPGHGEGDRSEPRTSIKLTGNSKAKARIPSTAGKHDETVMREIVNYLQRFPPPSASLSTSSAPSLYNEMMESPGTLSPADLVDDVFHFEDPQTCKNPTSDECGSLTVSKSSDYKIEQRMRPDFPQDQRKPFVTDLHLTETGQLVFLDAANHCLKRVDLRRPSIVPDSLPVTKPLSMCSAGWERVMVNCAGRVLSIYAVGAPQVRLVATRCTRHQYRGLVRASDALVAAASPETRSVDLLDLAGRVLRSLMPVDFQTGPEVVGCTVDGHLLAVHQPLKPPTTLLCFDMCGQIVWEHEMRTCSRHVNICKVIGGMDGCVYYALQGDSAIYRMCPQTGDESALLTSKNGILFPSSVVVDGKGRVFVTRNELFSDHFTSPDSVPMLPTTTEIDVFVSSSLCKDRLNT